MTSRREKTEAHVVRGREVTSVFNFKYEIRFRNVGTLGGFDYKGAILACSKLSGYVLKSTLLDTQNINE
jgi:hypothetical protein